MTSTIYVKVAKEFLVKELQKYYDKSSAKDLSFLAKFTRNIDLSHLKKQESSSTATTVEDYEGNQSDLENRDELKAFLQDLYDKDEALISQAGEDPGTLHALITKMSYALDQLHSKLKTLNPSLLDRPADEEPYNIFYYHAARFYADEIFKAAIKQKTVTGSVLKGLGSLVGISASTTRRKKEDTLKGHIAWCHTNIKPMIEGNQQERQIARYNIVDGALKLIQQQNEGISKEDQYLPSIPFHLVIATQLEATPKFRPSRGRLKKYMEDAQADLKKLSIAKLAAKQAEKEARASNPLLSKATKYDTTSKHPRQEEKSRQASSSNLSKRTMYKSESESEEEIAQEFQNKSSKKPTTKTHLKNQRIIHKEESSGSESAEEPPKKPQGKSTRQAIAQSSPKGKQKEEGLSESEKEDRSSDSESQEESSKPIQSQKKLPSQPKAGTMFASQKKPVANKKEPASNLNSDEETPPPPKPSSKSKQSVTSTQSTLFNQKSKTNSKSGAKETTEEDANMLSLSD